MKYCKRKGCYYCKGAHHSSIDDERTVRTDDTARELDVREHVTGYTSTNDCVMSLVPFPVKGYDIWGILDTRSTKNWISLTAVRNLKLTLHRWEMIKHRTAEGSCPLRKKTIYKLFTYTHQGGKFEFEAVGTDQENFSVLERASSKELKNKYDNLKGLYIPNSTDGRYVIHLLIGDPMFT